MTQKELQDTIIVTGWKSAYITKGIKNKSAMSQVRRKITESEILGLIAWYSEQKFEKDNCDEYDVVLDCKTVLTIKKPKEDEQYLNDSKK